jgi:hypothetical protein
MRAQCAAQAVWTGPQVKGPRSSVKLIIGWKVSPLSSLVARLKPSVTPSAQA